MPKRFQAELAVNQLALMSTGGWAGTPYIRTHVHAPQHLTLDYVYYICVYICMHIYMFVYTLIYICMYMNIQYVVQ